MKCILIGGEIRRVPDFEAKKMVGEGRATYTSKKVWKEKTRAEIDKQIVEAVKRVRENTGEVTYIAGIGEIKKGDKIHVTVAGNITRSHMEGKIRVIDKLEFTGVGVHRSAYKPPKIKAKDRRAAEKKSRDRNRGGKG